MSDLDRLVHEAMQNAPHDGKPYRQARAAIAFLRTALDIAPPPGAPPTPAPGMQPGQQCAKSRWHDGGPHVPASPTTEDMWRRGKYYGERCPYVAPTSPTESAAQQAPCERCSGARAIWQGGFGNDVWTDLPSANPDAYRYNRRIPCPACAPQRGPQP